MMVKLIAWGYKNVVKRMLFKLDPELVHDHMISLSAKISKNSVIKRVMRWIFRFDDKRLEQNVCGLHFKNPVGLSAGFDKNAEVHNLMYDVGFGFEQVGSVTLGAYEGNPKPRLHRLKKSEGIVVYYGLKNIGVDNIIPRLKVRSDKDLLLGVSIAKTNCSATAGLENGVEDYFGCVKKVVEAGVGDFYTINISCPNAFGGEPFVDVMSLGALLARLFELKIDKPVFIKMPLDMEWLDFKKLLDVIVRYPVAGVVIANLLKDRGNAGIKDVVTDDMKGGISGRPTSQKSNELIRQTYKEYGDKLVIFGVGGIFSAEDAYEKIKCGATCVQLITGMIYEGPQLVGEINRGLVRLMERDGYSNISEVVGTGA